MTYLRRIARWAGVHSQALGLSFLFVITASTILWFFVLFVPGHRQAGIGTWRRDLSVIADTRRDLLDRRISDGLAGASFVATFPSVRALVSSVPHESLGALSVPRINAILSDFRNVYGKRSISISNADGATVASSDGPGTGADAVALAREAAQTGEPRIDLVREPDGVIGFTIAVPARAEADAPEALAGQARGAVLVVADAREALFDLLRQPFTFTAGTGEVLLVRKEGDSALYLSPLRFRPDPPLTFRRALDVSGFTARGALEGDLFGSFVDYRGARVYAAVRRLKNAPWGLVVKVDEDEALAPFRRDVFRKGLTLGGLLLALIATAFGLWRALVASHEVTLARSEARFGALVEQATDAILLVGSDGRVLQANRVAERIYGRTRQELLSLHATDLRASSTRDALRHDLETAAAKGSLLIETLHQRADGSEFPVEVNMGLVKAGSESHILAIVRDITARKAAEDRIGALNRLLRTTSEVNQLLVRATDDESFLKDVCRILVESGGYALAWIGRADRETRRVVPVASAGDQGYLEDIEVRWDESPEGRGPMGTAIREGHAAIVSDVQVEPTVTPWRSFMLRHHFGSAAALPVRRGGAVTAGLIVYAREKAFIDKEEAALLEELAGDISFALDVLDARARANKSELYFRSLIEHSVDIIAVLSPDAVLQYVNPAAERLLGYNAQELQGHSAFDLTHPEDLAEAQRRVRRILETGTSMEQFEFRMRHRDGSWRTLSVIGSPLPVEIGRGLIINARDLTERQHLEAQFRQAQKMEAVGRLAGGVAHDFNNLLTVIQGYADLLGNDSWVDEGEERTEAIEQIRVASQRAAALTGQLLAFSRQQVLQPKVLELNTVVSNLVPMLRRVIGENIELVTNLDPRGERVLADAGQLEQVIVNLVLNSRDAMPQGGTLTIGTGSCDVTELPAVEPETPPGRYGRLTVKDTGMGLSPEVQARVFEPFFTTKEAGKGTGLGLATVYGIVKQSGGFVQLLSELGHGATFNVYLPCTEGELPRVEPVSGIRWALSSETIILLIEDEEAVRKLLFSVLKGHGYTVLEASSGQEALAIASGHSGPIHLVLCDVVMPGKGGPETVADLQHSRPTAQVIFMSGYTDDSVLRHGLAESGRHFLQKPFTPVSLLKKVREVLKS